MALGETALSPVIPPRNSGVVSLVFVVLGIGVFCPFNAFINARPYFEARLCQESFYFAENVEIWFSILYNFASVVSLVVLLVLQYYSQNENSSVRSLLDSPACHVLSWRASRRRSAGQSDDAAAMVLAPLSIYLATFLFMTAMVFFPAAPAVFVFFGTLIGLFLCGVCASVASAGIIGTAGLFGNEVGIGSYLQGQAAGGLIVATINIAAAWTDDPKLYQQHVCQSPLNESDLSDDMSFLDICTPYQEVSISTALSFFSNCVIIAGCIMGYIYVDKKKHELKAISQSYSPVVDIPRRFIRKFLASDTKSFSSSSSGIGDLELSDDGYEEGEDSVHGVHSMRRRSSTLSVWKMVKLPAIAIFLTYTVTLAIFPVITSDLSSVRECSSNSRLSNDLFVPATFFVFNLGDLVGRFVVDDFPIKKNLQLPKKLVLTSVARFLFIPLFFLCFSKKSLYKDMAVHSDTFSWLIQFAMAVSNGMLTTTCFSVAATVVPAEENLQQVASSILNLCLCLGLVVGGMIASPLLWLFTGQW